MATLFKSHRLMATCTGRYNLFSPSYCRLSRNTGAPFSTSTPNLSQEQGGGLELNYEWLTPKGADSRHVVVFLHGLLGNGRNLRTMAKKMCDTFIQPGLLLDLRGHGSSPVPPNGSKTTFDACVQDLKLTFEEIPQITNNSPITLVGHSWGGRVSLQYAFNALQQTDLPRPKRVWLLDTVPGHANSSVERVIRTVTEVSSKERMTDRKKVTEQLISLGIEQGTAQWLASSLQRKSDGTFQFSFDLDVIQELLPEFQNQDYIGMLETVTTKGGIRVDLVRGGKNKGWTEDVMKPLKALEGPNFGIHTLPQAGHWLHVEDLQGLLEVVDVSYP